jgi:hypothetical protein
MVKAAYRKSSQGGGAIVIETETETETEREGDRLSDKKAACPATADDLQFNHDLPS